MITMFIFSQEPYKNCLKGIMYTYGNQCKEIEEKNRIRKTRDLSHWQKVQEMGVQVEKNHCRFKQEIQTMRTTERVNWNFCPNLHLTAKLYANDRIALEPNFKKQAEASQA